jgi:hypothetical protein
MVRFSQLRAGNEGIHDSLEENDDILNNNKNPTKLNTDRRQDDIGCSPQRYWVLETWAYIRIYDIYDQK